MPQREGNTDDRFKRLRRAASRRRFMATTLAASVGALAGCGQGGEDTATPGDEDTPTPTEGDGGMGTPTDTPGMDETPTDSPTPTETQGPPVENSFTGILPTVPEQSFLYEYGPSGALNNDGIGWVIELTMPFREGTTDFQTSGQTWNIEGIGETEVMCWIDDYSITPPFEWTEVYDDRTTYWDGTPMDANAYEHDLKIGYYGEGNGHFTAGTPNWDVQSQWELLQWQDKGEEEGVSANPANRFAIELNNIGRYLAPPHPGFTESYATSLENAETQEEVDDLWSEIQGEAVTFFDFAENGWGSGLYEIESADDVTNDQIQLSAREDHPNHHEQTIDNLTLNVATGDRTNILMNEGRTDIRQTVIAEESTAVNRQTLPDHIQQLDLTGSNAIFGVPMNWQGAMGNIWVRRAFIEAIDWDAIMQNATSPRGYQLLQHQTGMSDAISESWLSQDHLDSMHSWSFEADREQAAEYMRMGGYSKQGGTWVGPDGEEISLVGKAAAGYGDSYVIALQGIKASMDEFGVPTQFNNVSTQAFNTSRDNMTYDILWQWNNQRSPWEAYTSSSGWWNPKIVERDPDFPNSFDGWGDAPNGRSPDLEDVENDSGEVQPADEMDLRGQPLTQQIPTEVGNISAPENPDNPRQPDLEAAGIDSKEINLMSHLLEMHTDTELTEDRLQTILQDLSWYHNYYNPDWWPTTYTTGIAGNLRDYRWATGTEATVSNARLGANMDHYHAQGGLVFKKYNEDFPSP